MGGGGGRGEPGRVDAVRRGDDLEGAGEEAGAVSLGQGGGAGGADGRGRVGQANHHHHEAVKKQQRRAINNYDNVPLFSPPDFVPFLRQGEESVQGAEEVSGGIGFASVA